MGMEFDVISDKGEDIRDPDTREILGSVVLAKTRVRITQVEERLAVASTQSKRINVEGSTLGVFARSLMPTNRVTRHESLKQSDDARWQDLDESESFVKIGDPVVQVLAEAED